MFTVKSFFIYCAILGFIVSDCSLGTPDGPLIPQTEIIEINLTPDTVAAGDTVLIHGIIEDSLDNRFTYYWGFPEDEKIPVNGTIFGPKIKWKAKATSDTTGKVVDASTTLRVDNGSQDSVSVTEGFRIPILN
jgi:hypothetical protein